MTPLIWIATCLDMPEPDPDEALLLESLRAAALDARLAAWNDPTVDWASGALVIIRSTWDYVHERSRFVAWAERVAQVSRLWNPASTVAWNTHKRYLIELAQKGLPVVPTTLIAAGSTEDLKALVVAQGWREVVIKPAVSAGSYETHRIGSEACDEGQRHLDRLVAQGDVLVQQYLPSVTGYGERALVWINGELTHAVRKSPRFSTDSESVERVWTITPDERALADAALQMVPAPLLYARIDMAPGPDGRPLLMELELVEPSLFLGECAEALARLVSVVQRRASA